MTDRGTSSGTASGAAYGTSSGTSSGAAYGTSSDTACGNPSGNHLPTKEEVSEYTPARLLDFLKVELAGLPCEVWDILQGVSLNGATFLGAAGNVRAFRAFGIEVGPSRLLASTGVEIREGGYGWNGELYCW
jgi:hypothetical protein